MEMAHKPQDAWGAICICICKVIYIYYFFYMEVIRCGSLETGLIELSTQLVASTSSSRLSNINTTDMSLTTDMLSDVGT